MMFLDFYTCKNGKRKLEWEDRWIQFSVFKTDKHICGNVQDLSSVRCCFVYLILCDKPPPNFKINHFICSWSCSLDWAHIDGSLAVLEASHLELARSWAQLRVWVAGVFLLSPCSLRTSPNGVFYRVDILFTW